MEFINMLINDVTTGEALPGQALRTATIALSARVFEKIGDNHYSWKGSKLLENTILPAFNEKAVQKFWSGYMVSNNIIAKTANTTVIDIILLGKIIASLDSKEDHIFKKGTALDLN